MEGKIYHEWNGTVLTITSDSGTSSADLKGDTGARGAQGKCGVVVDEEGNVLVNVATEEYVAEQITKVNTGGSVDLSNYATKKYVDDAVAASGGTGEGGTVNVDLTNYYTKDETDQKIEDAQLSSGEVDLTGYATEEYVQAKIAEAQLSSGEGTTVDLSAYALKSEIPTVPTNVSAFTNDANYATTSYVDQKVASSGGSGSGESVDLTDYYTKTEIDNKGYQTEEQVNALIQSALNAIGSAEGGAY